MSRGTITAGIICRNAQDTIGNTLESVRWVDRILVLDDGSTDDTTSIVSKYTDDILTAKSKRFDEKRNQLLAATKTDWIFYVDADEVVSSALGSEIKAVIDNDRSAEVYSVKRVNYLLGVEMGSEYLERLFRVSSLEGWKGSVHETPIYTGQAVKLKNPLLHYTHRDISSMMEKTNQWSEFEAELRFKADHPLIRPWRLLRIAMSTTWDQFVRRSLLRYGRAGLFEGYFQVVDKLVVYTKLWELQKNSKS